MLTGEFRHILDTKNRIFMPSKHREELGAQFIVARDIREKCLKVYSLEGWANYIAPIKQLDRSLAEKTMRFLHRNASQAFKCCHIPVHFPVHVSVTFSF